MTDAGSVLLSSVSRHGQAIGNAHGPGNGSIWLDDVGCLGNERSLGDCSHRPWGSHNCLHDEDVSISCHRGTPHVGNYTPRIMEY